MTVCYRLNVLLQYGDIICAVQAVSEDFLGQTTQAINQNLSLKRCSQPSFQIDTFGSENMGFLTEYV